MQLNRLVGAERLWRSIRDASRTYLQRGRKFHPARIRMPPAQRERQITHICRAAYSHSRQFITGPIFQGQTRSRADPTDRDLLITYVSDRIGQNRIKAVQHTWLATSDKPALVGIAVV